MPEIIPPHPRIASPDEWRTERLEQLKHEKDADFETAKAQTDKVPPKTSV